MPATLRLTIGVFAVALLSSCTTVENTINYEDSSQILTSVSVAPPNPRVGETIEIKISHENVGKRDLELKFDVGGGTGFVIFRDGKRISPRYIKAVQAVSVMNLKAGETNTVTKILKLANNYEQGADRTSPVNYYRGEYEVRAGLMGYSDVYPWAITHFTIRQ